MPTPRLRLLWAILALALAACAEDAKQTAADGDRETASELDQDNGEDYPLPYAMPLHTEGRWIKDALGANVMLKGVNVNGGEGPDMVMNGLDKGELGALAHAVAAKGFNSVRLVWSNELVEKNAVIPQEKLAANPALVGKTAMEIMDAAVEAFALEGLMIIMNNHISDAKWCCQVGDGNALWYNERFPESAWIEDWKAIARRYRDNPAVIGADLRNEPRMPAEWGEILGRENDWAAAAERGGEAVLSEAPDWLILVEGTGFGRNLSGALKRPIRLSIPGRLVYSSHDYSWSQRKGVDSEVNSYEELRDSCDAMWGFLLEEGKPYTAPVWLGEFGTANDAWRDGQPKDTLWFSAIVRYIREKQVGWSWWAMVIAEDWGLFNPATGEPYSPELVPTLMEETALENGR